MIAPENVAVVLLAAGLSTRFGSEDKLSYPLHGLPLGLHAARTLAHLPFAARIAVTREGGPDFAGYGFEPVINPDPANGQSSSLHLGIAAAREVQPQAILVALADMPRVSLAHFLSLLSSFDAHSPSVGSTAGEYPCPPALFGAALFPTLEGLRGDIGARALLRDAQLIPASPHELADFDNPDDLGRS